MSENTCTAIYMYCIYLYCRRTVLQENCTAKELHCKIIVMQKNCTARELLQDIYCKRTVLQENYCKRNIARFLLQENRRVTQLGYVSGSRVWSEDCLLSFLPGSSLLSQVSYIEAHFCKCVELYSIGWFSSLAPP